MSGLTVEVSEERRSKLHRIMAHYELRTMTAAIWYAVNELYKRIGKKGETV
jgi:hypothetical protein